MKKIERKNLYLQQDVFNMKAPIYDFKALSIDGKEIDFSTYEGKTLLIVNTASKCSFTPQYAGLEKLYKKYKNKGLVILGFPCNQFGNQEPGDEKEIQDNCLVNYGVTFPVFEKVEVNGANEHPLFTYLKKELPGFFGKRINWNFTKFLIDKNGVPVKRFASYRKPRKMEKRIVRIL